MPKISKELTDMAVKRLKSRKVLNKTHKGNKSGKPNKNFGKLVTAYHPVGGVSGLLLRVTPQGARSWILRTVVGSRRRDIGLGGYPEVKLTEARERARKDKNDIRQGIDPVEQRRKLKEALRAEYETRKTFAEVWPEFFKAKRKNWGAKNQQHWKASIETYALPIIGSIIVADLETRHIESVLNPIWIKKTMLAKKLRGRIEAVLSFAAVKGYRTGDNPARWADNLAEILPKPSKVHTTKHYPALPIDEAPKFIQALRNREGIAARGLEFAILTAARSGEVRGARWDEIDIKRGRWVVPAERMKMQKDHTVPLTDAALVLLKHMARDSELIFPAPRGGKLSDMSISAVVKRMHEDEIKSGNLGWIDPTSAEKDDNGNSIKGTERRVVPHGFRSTFKDWATEETDVQDFISEMALAHHIGDEVQEAYKRSDLAAKRLKLMREWSRYLGYAEQGAKVVNIA